MTEEHDDQTEELLLTVPRSSFDLLEGAAEDKGRTRVLNAILLILFVAIIATLASRSALTYLETAVARDDTKVLTEESDAITRELAERRRNGEVSRTALDKHIEERLTVVDEVAGNELAYSRIIREVNALGSGITIGSVEFTGAGDKTPAAEGSNESDDASDTAGQSGITITGTATDASVAAAATNALSNPARFPYLVTAEPGNVNCGAAGSGGCTWTWNGTITDEGRTNRAEELRARVTTPLPNQGGGN